MHLPSYSIGSKVYDKIPEICEPYGTKVIAIGGHKAINAAKDKIIKACEKSNLEILDFIWSCLWLRILFPNGDDPKKKLSTR